MSTNDERRPPASRREDHTTDALSPEEARFVSRVADGSRPCPLPGTARRPACAGHTAGGLALARPGDERVLPEDSPA
jgi:hypothetical protein